MKDFRELKVWEKAHLLVLAVYQATGTFPRQELYSLTNQIQRAAVSIPTNIAEGCGKVEMLISAATFKLPWALPANWNTFSCLHTIYHIFRRRLIKPYQAN
jgi:hypothetical protein